jgi:hypothetical protein
MLTTWAVTQSKTCVMIVDKSIVGSVSVAVGFASADTANKNVNASMVITTVKNFFFALLSFLMV